MTLSFVGCDLHKKAITMCVVNQARVPSAGRRLDCTCAAGITIRLTRLPLFQLVVEATAGDEWKHEAVPSLA